ncbi:MAG: hypothetical protein JO224_13025 [Pelomonas sp.]|nr:hypothetical protein [Roseateles sp.]
MQDYPQEAREDPRTLWEAAMDAKYAVVAHGLAETYYASKNKLIVFAQVLLTSGMVAGAARHDAEMSFSVGVCLAIVSAYQQASKPLAESAKHGTAREKFSQLVARISKSPLSIEVIDEQLATLGAKAPPIPRAIQFAAYNDNLRTNGRPDGILKEALLTRLVRFMA